VGIENTFGDPNSVAPSILYSLPILVFLYTIREDFTREWPASWRKAFRMGLIAYAGMAVVALMLTQSRGGAVGLVYEGVWHYPANCYQASGWQNVDSRKETLFVEGAPERTVSISTWSHSGRTVKVLYWYQLGEHTIFGRMDLGKARLALAGQATWPPLVKVLLQTDADNSAEAEQALIDLGGRIHQWLAAKGGLGAEEIKEDPDSEGLSPMPAAPLDGGDDLVPPIEPPGASEPALPLDS